MKKEPHRTRDDEDELKESRVKRKKCCVSYWTPRVISLIIMAFESPGTNEEIVSAEEEKMKGKKYKVAVAR